jgi:hypothetical protein
VTDVEILGGQPLELDPAGSGRVQLYSDDAGRPYGLAIESNVKFPIAPLTGDPAGEGFDYTNFNRGGKVAVFHSGGEFELFDDGRGLPYATGTYTINYPVYANESGLISHSSTDAVEVGSVVDFDTATDPTRLRIKLNLI